MSLTKANRARLEKLATYLEGLPKRYRHFDMSLWLDDNGDPEAVKKYALENGGVEQCGTVACAVGHGPAAGILFKPDMFWGFRNDKPGWESYAALFTGGDELRFRWLFDADWAACDNHHHGAAARIRYLLDKGRPPADFMTPRPKWREAYASYRIDAKAPANA